MLHEPLSLKLQIVYISRENIFCNKDPANFVQKVATTVIMANTRFKYTRLLINMHGSTWSSG